MARKKIGLQVKGFEEYMAKLDEVGGSAAMKKGVKEALIASKKYVTPLIEKAMSESNLPASGEYATGLTKDSIDKEMKVYYDGITAFVKVGFDFEKSGMTSIFLMHGTELNGTPRMQPVKGLKSAIYGSKTQKQIGEIQAEALNKVIAEIMEG